MYPNTDKLKALLIGENYLSEADAQAAQAASSDSTGFVEYLIRQQLLTKALLGQAIAESYTLPYADLGVNQITKEQITNIPEDLARKFRIVLVKQSDTDATIATDTPESIPAGTLEPFFRGKTVHIAYTLPEYIETSFSLYEKPLDTRFSQIISGGQRIAPEIVDEIIKDALAYHASDIHFEPLVKEVIVRFRVDGALREAGKIAKEYYENILNRIKVESGMRIDEHLTAQDGALQRINENTATDLRVSLIPTVNGEKVVMRVLSSYVQSYGLSDVGLDEAHRSMIETYAQKPYGMILTVGPTGSGKTTTLYALLKLVNKPNVNITTIEDPVEYKLAGANQIQVREAGNMTFARGLRAIVRQDPDIILVGEIRDRETAEISVNAALTGHLLLSTFHANDASTSIPRLIEMGIEPFLLASTLEIVIAQRLVRKICNNCRYSMPIMHALSGIKGNIPAVAKYFNRNDTVYAGKGCPACNSTGFTGRSALFEFIEITPEMQELILRTPSTREIEMLARSQGSRHMFEDGIAKVKSGLTTIAEVMRIVEPPTPLHANQHKVAHETT